MPPLSTDLVPGTLDVLILRCVSLEPMHGFSKGVFRVNPGSLLVAFQRLEGDGYVKGEWRQSENNRRAKYYRITERGRKQLEAETESWTVRMAAIARLIEA
jgi:PadR family transcriptional regulator PadR